MINGVEAGRYQITEFAGYVSFATSKGSIQLRSIYPRPVEAAVVVPASVHRIPDPGVTSPEIVREVKPDYTEQAMRGLIEGIVEIEAVVRPDGRVGHVRVIRTLDPGLDQMAIDAVSSGGSSQDLREGHPVSVLVNIELTFTIK